jgi:hypothetical protein
MTVQQAGGWSRREFLRSLAVAGAAGVFGVYSGPVRVVETVQAHEPTDTPPALGTCPQRAANAQEICPNCCYSRAESM